MATDQATAAAPPQMYLIRIRTPPGAEPFDGFDQRARIAFKDGKAYTDDPEIVKYAKAQTNWETTKVGPATKTAQIEETTDAGGGAAPAPVSDPSAVAPPGTVPEPPAAGPEAPTVAPPEGTAPGKRVRFKTKSGQLQGTITKVNPATITVDQDDGLSQRVDHGKYELVSK